MTSPAEKRRINEQQQLDYVTAKRAWIHEEQVARAMLRSARDSLVRATQSSAATKTLKDRIQILDQCIELLATPTEPRLSAEYAKR